MRLLLITNILTPYRIYFYNELNDYIKSIGGELKVAVMSETEPNRNWKYNEFKASYTTLLDSKSYNLKGDIFIHIPKNIKKIILDFRPTIVMVGGSYQNPSIFTLSKNKKKFKYELIFWSESHLEEEKGYGKVKILIREVLRKIMLSKFDGFCVPGEMARRFVEKYNKNKKKYNLPNLVDYNYYTRAFSERSSKKQVLREKYNLNLTDIICLIPARLAPVKGILEFLSIFKDVKSHKKVKIIIAGTGELEKNILNYCKRENLNVKLVGSKSQEEMLELYTLVDCLVLPSLSDPNPLSCIEALWSGLPLIVSNKVGNHLETVKEGKNGFVFSYENREETINKIENFINKDSLWKKNASNISREIAENLYMPHKVIKSLINKLEEEG